MNTLEILVLSLCIMGFWVCYEVINGLYGAKIKARMQEQADKNKAIKIWEQNQLDIKLRFAKSQEVQEVEVEVVEDYRPAWNVRYNESQTKYDTQLIDIGTGYP